MFTRTKFIILTLALLGTAVGLMAADDPFVATWKLNLSKSKYNPGPPPKDSNRYMKFEPASNGALKLTISTVDAAGKTHSEVRMETYDGKPHPVEADPNVADAASEKRIDAYTQEIQNWRKGKVAVRLTRTVSKDGKTLTLKAKGSYENGQTFDDVRVYDRQ
jgi:hypothetical protein